MPDPSDRNYFVGGGSSGDATRLPDFPAGWTQEPTSPLLPEKEAPEGTPPPELLGDGEYRVSRCTKPPSLDAMREILDEQNREKARHALTEEQARKAIDEWRGKNPAWCVERIRELEREVKSLQSQITDLRLTVKGLQ